MERVVVLSLPRRTLALAALMVLSVIAWLGLAPTVGAQPAPASRSAAPPGPPADPWPRDISISDAAVLIYQPQVSKWEGNRIDFRAALAIKPTGAKEETFGVIFATARTQVDKVDRMAVFEELKITKG